MKEVKCESCGEIINPTYSGDPDMRLCQECWDSRQFTRRLSKAMNAWATEVDEKLRANHPCAKLHR